ncbi:lysophospholipid acyltransferase family protein [Herminiimonas fonticola]|uniref:lysophospholipid acyltransferase family protein n=1 Tax=Herminiimonas fonticola TaxID=303380 RepID=UPI00333EEE2D
MIVVPFVRVMLHLLRGLATAAFVFPWVASASHDRLSQKWAAGLLSILHIKVDLLPGAVPVHRALIVANHVSWLDIFVINSQQPCRFVAKADIRKWPVLGWLCAQGGTIFIARGKQREVRRVYAGLVHSIEAGERIAFFPEGTTVAQGSLLPFHANLFEAAIEAQVPVQPYAIRYVDEHGNLHSAADFIGDMSFVDSMLLIMKTRKMTAQLIVLPTIDTAGAHRRELAQAARESIADTLGYAERAEQVQVA